MLTKTKRLLLLSMAGLFVLPSFLNVILPPTVVNAAEQNPSDQLERWLYYRGMRACLESPDFDGTIPAHDNRTISVSDLEEKGLQEFNHKEGFGYLGKDMDNDDSNDGTVKCNDGSIWVRGANLFGFGTVKNLVCAMNEAADQLEDGGRISPKPDVPPCVDNATEFELDGGGGSIWQQMLTKALEDPISSDYGGDGNRPSFNFNDNAGPDYTYKSLLYLLGKNSLETFCGGSLSDAQPNNNYDGSDQGVSVYIVNSDGTIKESGAGAAGFSHTYVVTQKDNESDAVDDVYYRNGGNDNEADDRSCEDMARWTREGARDYATWARAHPTEAGQNENPSNPTSDNPDAEEGTSCAIDGIGWLICPVLNLVARLNDEAFNVIAGFLEIEPKLLADDATKGAWESFRNIANIAFVIAFLLIIYSQMTGAGVSNYGIKKLLPKLIIAAILVNVSYYVCQIAVDLSNIIGSSIYGFFKDIPTSVGGTAASSDLTWGSVMGVALAATAAVLGALLLASTLGGAALLAFLLVVLILVARKAILILLIVISPLAFVAYLLPNTNQWFKKWWSLFTKLLMVFPVVGVIFGASFLASRIIGGQSSDLLVQLTALGIMAIPLFAVPMALKGAMAATGSLGAKLNGGLDKATGAAKGNIKKGRSGEFLAARAARKQSRQIRRRTGDGFIARRGKSLTSRFGEDTALGRVGKGVTVAGSLGSRFDQTKAGKFAGGDRGAAAATAAYNKELGEETERQMQTMSEFGADKLLSVATDRKQTTERRAAALRKLETTGGDQHIQAAYDYLGREGAKKGSSDYDSSIGDIQQLAASALQKRKPAGISTTQGNSLGTGTLGLDYEGNSDTTVGAGYKSMLAKRLQEGAFGAGDFARMGKDDLIRLGEMSRDGALTDDDLDAMTAHFAAIESDETLKGTMTDERKALFESIMDRGGPRKAQPGANGQPEYHQLRPL